MTTADKGGTSVDSGPSGSDAFAGAVEMSLQVSASAAPKVGPTGVSEETKTSLEAAAAASDGAKMKGRLAKRPPPIKAGASKKRPAPPSETPPVASEPSAAGTPGTPKSGTTLKQGNRGRECTGEVRARITDERTQKPSP
jgi:hypothetical protein